MKIGQRIKINRVGGGVYFYGVITGESVDVFNNSRVYIIAIDGQRGEYGAHPESLTITRKKRKPTTDKTEEQ
jgi:hypothetical protein